MLRFLPGRSVLGSGRVRFDDAARAAAASPLAARIFELPDVTAVVLESDSLLVGKAEGEGTVEWRQLKPMVLAAIMDHYLTGLPVVNGSAHSAAPEAEAAERPEVEQDIIDLLEARIRPGMVRSGGDVSFVAFEPMTGTVRLRITASRFSEPLFALQVRIENTLVHHIPEVSRVACELAGDDADVAGPVAERIRALLDQEINPAIAAHGGYISLVSLEEDVAYLRMDGGCQGCGMADVTLREGVAARIREAVPEIADVRDVTDHGQGANPYYQP